VVRQPNLSLRLRHTSAMRDEPSSRSDRPADESAPAPEQQSGFGELRHYVPPELLNVSFPVAVRGYDRAAVEAYVKRVNRVIAELKVSASPRAAVTHALEQTEQQVSGLLQRARETGEEITASARQEAEEIVGKAKADAAELHVNVSTEADGIKAEAEQVIADARAEAEDILARSRMEADNTRSAAQAEAEERRRQLEEELESLRARAEARMRELEADTDRVRGERRELLEDIRVRGTTLLGVADAADEREPDAPESVDEIERAGVD
jgi:DivIVA domain-containing protein